MTHPELPQDLDAEKAVLGSVLLNRDALTQIAPWFKPELFYLDRHGLIFGAMRHLYERRVPPDVRLVAAELRARGQLDAIGGVEYLSDLSDAVPTSYHIEHYARTVERLALHRRAIALGGQIAARGYSASGSADELRADVQALVSSLLGAAGGARGLTPLGDVLDQILQRAGEAETEASVLTGLTDYDALTGGLWPGQLVVPAGRPGHGKSSFVATIAANIAARGHAVVYISLEMEQTEVAQRLLSADTGIDGMELRRGQLDEAELMRITESAGPMSMWPFYLEDRRMALSEIRALVLQHIAEHGPITLLVIDYIQLIPPDRRTGNRQQDIGEITRGLKALAKEARCTIYAPSQLSREIERRDSPIPTLADLRESGDIENDADRIVFVVRPELFLKKDDDEGQAEAGVASLYIAKHRGGRLGKVDVRFDAERTRFVDLTWRDAEGY